MSLEHAILGFLNYGPLTGYQLKKIFDTSVRHFWPADQSQIYRTLTRLNEQSWAEMELVEQTDRPDRKVYHITPAGQNELRTWLLSPLTPPEMRNPLLIQVFFAGQLSDEEAIAMFERSAAALRAQMGVYQHIPQNIEAYAEYTDSPREFFFWMLTLRSGIITAQANLEFIEEAIRCIREHAFLTPAATKETERGSHE